MTRRRYFLAVGALVAIGAVCGTFLNADDRPTPDPYVGGYVGTFHPRRQSCDSCHAKARISREDTRHVLEINIDYTAERAKCQGKTNLVFTMEGTATLTNLVLTSKRYKATTTGNEIVARRLAKNAKVPTVLKLKRAPELEKAKPRSATSKEE